MALRTGSDYYTKFVFSENGKDLARRIHRLEVQGPDGRVHVFTGENLPDFIYGFSGHAYKGEHLLTVLVSKRPKRTFQPAQILWPTGRDVMHVIIGMMMAFSWIFFMDVMSQML